MSGTANEISEGLTLALIARNEEATIGRCLESVRGVANEVVVVDTGSTDSTRRIAEDAGARVFEFVWRDDFSAARNEALKHARCGMVLFLDADEWIEPHSLPELECTLREGRNAGHYLTQVNACHDGTEIRNRLVRLFPNLPGVRFIHAVHEDVIPSLLALGIPIRNSGIDIGHSGYGDAGVVARKSARNFSILEKSLSAGLDAETEPHARYNLGDALFAKGSFREALEQFEWCIATCGSGSPIGRICSLRAADCHFQLGDPEKSLALLPSTPEAGGHPGASFLSARILHRTSPEAARPWLEAVLASPDAAYAPPVALAKLKLGALAALGSIWLGKGRPDVAAKILGLTEKVKSGAGDGAGMLVWAEYRRAAGLP